MTMPGVFHRVVADPALAIAPDVAQSGTPAEEDASAAAAQFGLALTALLAHAAEPAEGAPAHEASSGEAAPTAEATAAITLAAPSRPDAVATTDTTSVTRGLDLVAPELRARLERVIERMESEYGYQVEVVETYRSQARQNALFAQGRTEPGPVVTWTRASNHTSGRAADLVIDGSYDAALPYERLMRIAREEGLRTLGPRDPGHVELPSSSSRFAAAPGSTDETSASRPSYDSHGPVIARPTPFVASQASIVAGAAELERPAQPADPARLVREIAVVAPVARVAPVALPAAVATVAQVAQVATIGAQAAPVVHPARRGTEPAAPRAVQTRREGDATTPARPGVEQASPASRLSVSATHPDVDAESGGDNGFGEPNDERPARSRLDPSAARHGATEILAKARDELFRAVAGTDSSATASSPPGTRETAGPELGHADMSERIARVLKVQDAAGDRPLSQVLLRLERPDGGEDRLRVDLRGNTVSATLDVGDQGSADRLNANVKELQRTLERHGFETDSLTVRTATRSMESSTMARGAGASIEADLQRTSAGAGSNNNANTSSRERGARHDEQRPSPDSQRHRSRREHKGGRS
jgi:hypothetical protein